MGPSLLWFFAFSAVFAGVGRTRFFFHLQMDHTFAVQDKFTRKTQDLNPECKEGSILIMQLGVLLGLLTATLY